MNQEEWNKLTPEEQWDEHQLLMAVYLKEVDRLIESERWNEELSNEVFFMRHLEDHVGYLEGYLSTWRKDLKTAQEAINKHSANK